MSGTKVKNMSKKTNTLRIKVEPDENDSSPIPENVETTPMEVVDAQEDNVEEKPKKKAASKKRPRPQEEEEEEEKEEEDDEDDDDEEEEDDEDDDEDEEKATKKRKAKKMKKAKDWKMLETDPRGSITLNVLDIDPMKINPTKWVETPAPGGLTDIRRYYGYGATNNFLNMVIEMVTVIWGLTYKFTADEATGEMKCAKDCGCALGFKGIKVGWDYDKEEYVFPPNMSQYERDVYLKLKAIEDRLHHLNMESPPPMVNKHKFVKAKNCIIRSGEKSTDMEIKAKLKRHHQDAAGKKIVVPAGSGLDIKTNFGKDKKGREILYKDIQLISAGMICKQAVISLSSAAYNAKSGCWPQMRVAQLECLIRGENPFERNKDFIIPDSLRIDKKKYENDENFMRREKEVAALLALQEKEDEERERKEQEEFDAKQKLVDNENTEQKEEEEDDTKPIVGVSPMKLVEKKEESIPGETTLLNFSYKDDTTEQKEEETTA